MTGICSNHELISTQRHALSSVIGCRYKQKSPPRNVPTRPKQYKTANYRQGERELRSSAPPHGSRGPKAGFEMQFLKSNVYFLREELRTIPLSIWSQLFPIKLTTDDEKRDVRTLTEDQKAAVDHLALSWDLPVLTKTNRAWLLQSLLQHAVRSMSNRWLLIISCGSDYFLCQALSNFRI